MAELVKDFIKLMSVLIVILMIISVILDPKGILASVFSLKSYAEPLTLLDHLSAAIETASYTPGETTISFKTSGLPYIIEIFKKDGKYYASIDTSLVEQGANVQFQAIEPKILISDCEITEQKLVLREGLIQDIVIRKTMEGTNCIISMDSKKEEYDFNVSVSPGYLMVPNKTRVTTEVKVSLVKGTIAPEPVLLTAIGAPPGVEISFSKNSLNPTFTSIMTIYANESAVPGTYYISIIGTSGSMSRSTALEIEVSYVLFSFALETKTDIIYSPLTGVEVNVKDDIRYTREHTESISNTVYGLIPNESYEVSVEDPFNTRPFSHFRDFDCDGKGNISDTANNPYNFKMRYANRNMTAFYKVFTQIRNLEYDNITKIISGNLLDEDFNPIIKNTTKYDTCGVPTQVYPNRNITIQYLDVCNNIWMSISSIESSLASIPRFYDNFDSGDYDKWITTSTWNVTNGELNNTGTGQEMAQTKWNYWNGTSGENNNLEASVKISSGSNVSIRIFDAINDYYLQTDDSYNNMYLWVNGALAQSVSLTGINPSQWNTWRIKQNESYMEFYLNNKKIIKYSGIPLMNFGRVMLRTLNTRAAFDNVTVYDGSWSYNFSNIPCSVKKIRAAYISSDWYYNDSFADIDIDPATVLCKLIVDTIIDVPSLPLPGVKVNVSDGVLNKSYNNTTSGPLATAIFYLAATPLRIHNITVNDTFYLRNFSHYWDHDCDSLNVGYYLDNSSNPYWFSICRDKNITVQYKTFTNITNKSGTPNTFNFDFRVSRTIAGKLLDEYAKPIINRNGTGHTTCTPPALYDNFTINRNVSLEYFKNESWYYINSTDSLPDGNWSYDWGCACNATKLRTNYTPVAENWWYMPNSTTINITCPCLFLVFAQVDAYDTVTSKWPLKGVRVNVSNMINYTNASGYTEYYLFPGNYSIQVDNPFVDPNGNRSFSHFFDWDCNKTMMGCWLDTTSSPYNFGMYDREKNMTAQYKAFTYITDTNNTPGSLEFNGTYIKGKLLDERNLSIITGPGNSHPKCELNTTPSTPVPINRNVTLEVYNKTDKKWYYLGAVDSNSDGSWNYTWIWDPRVNKIRANYTPLKENWYYMNSTATLALIKLTVMTFRDDSTSTPVQNVSVTFDGTTKSSGIPGIAEFLIKGTNHNLIVEDPKGNRPFSHFWDSDCDQNYINYYLDNISNPFNFKTWDRDRNITAFYKSFTNITNSSGANNAFDYDYTGYAISGKLLDERGMLIMYHPITGQYRTKHDICEDPTRRLDNIFVNRNVSLQYFDGSWHYINDTNSSISDGSWKYNWTCACNTTKLMANYTPITDNWFYIKTGAEINMDPSKCPCKVTVFTFEEIPNSAISDVNVTLDSPPPNLTDASGKTEFLAMPGSHNLMVDLLQGDLIMPRLGHFRDEDCSQSPKNQYKDVAGGGTYSFSIWDRNRNITAFYRTFANLTDASGNKNTFEYNGTHIKGKLLENGNTVLSAFRDYYSSGCGIITTRMFTDRNINLEYNSTTDNGWHTVPGSPVTASLANGSWILPWACTADAIQLKATYTPANWYYTSANATIIVNCMGTLEVHAFAPAGSEVSADYLQLNLGDTDWDEIVEISDLWFYDPANINNCMNTVPGDSRWDIDCDMNMDNIINSLDKQIVQDHQGIVTRNEDTPLLSKTLPVGTYELRSKYNHQIRINNSVVINPNKVTIVNFYFLTCDGFNALDCSTPLVAPGGQRVWVGSSSGCGRVGGAKVDCQEGYQTSKVCNIASPSTCVQVSPTINSYSVSSTSVLKDDPFSISVSGSCPNALPSDVPGYCLVECRVVDPDGIITDIDTWTDNPSAVTFSRTCEKVGNYIVDYCVVLTDFYKNRGWGYNYDTNTTIQCLPTYPLTFRAKTLGGTSLSISADVWDYTYGQFSCTPTPCTVNVPANPDYVIEVPSTVSSRDMSFFRDENCNGAGSLNDFTGGGSPTYQSGPSFVISNYGKTVTAFYKEGTSLATLSYDGASITGKLTNESGNGLPSSINYYSSCGSTSPNSINRNVVLEYHVKNDPPNAWNTITTVTASNADGSWTSQAFPCGNTYADQIRATYTSTNLYYTGTSYVYNYNCPPPSYPFTFTAQVDVTGEPLNGVSINIDGTPHTIVSGGTITFSLTVGSHTVTSVSGGSRTFSHIADFDCDGSGDTFDTNNLPYSFAMYSKARKMTAQYKTYTTTTISFTEPTISGKLSDENDNVLASCGWVQTACPSTSVCRSINRNVYLRYCKGASCYDINPSVDASSGSWSQGWSCGTTEATRLTATYTPAASNWWYSGSSRSLLITCPKTCDTLGGGCMPGTMGPDECLLGGDTCSCPDTPDCTTCCCIC